MSYTYLHFEEIDSTSSYLKRNFDNLDDFTICESDYQKEGRGRSGRKWISNKNENLMFSILLKDPTLINEISKLSVSSAYVLFLTIKELYPTLNPLYKWPNDIYINDKKISGILLESHMENNKINGIIIGIGINLNQKKFDDDLLFKASSLSNELNKDIDKELFKKTLYKNFDNYFKKLKEGNNEYLIFAKNNNYLKNKEVYALINNKKELVKVLDINNDLSLLIKLNDLEKSIYSGEITFHL